MHIKLEEALSKQIEDFRFEHRFETRSDAIRWLLGWALKQRPVPKPGKG